MSDFRDDSLKERHFDGCEQDRPCACTDVCLRQSADSLKLEEMLPAEIESELLRLRHACASSGIMAGREMDIDDSEELAALASLRSVISKYLLTPEEATLILSWHQNETQNGEAPREAEIATKMRRILQ